MPSHFHEALLLLFRNRPALAPELLREALNVQLPDYTDVRSLLAQMVSLGLDAERSTLYCDLILHSLPDAARRALQAMDASKYQYQSEFAQRYFGQGRAAGVAEGRTEIVLKQLATRYGAVSEVVEARVRTAGLTELDGIAQRLLTARTVEEALGIPRI